MNRTGYKAYLQTLDNQQHYIGRIQILLDLERELSIDLDDYIPYNEDYNKCAALDAILPQEKRYDERLWHSINSYMRYRLSDFDDNRRLADKQYHEATCSEYFTFNGSESDLIIELSKFMPEPASQIFISGLKEHLSLLEEQECFKEIPSFPEETTATSSGMLQLLIKSSNININIKATTILVLALLLDIKLTLGIASAALTIIGFNGQAIARIDVSEGEKCLILEALQRKNRIIDEDVFSSCNSECVHNDLKCKYQKEEKCTIRRDEIKHVLDVLCDKNIFKKIKNLYKYNF